MLEATQPVRRIDMGKTRARKVLFVKRNMKYDEKETKTNNANFNF